LSKKSYFLRNGVSVPSGKQEHKQLFQL